MDKIKRFVDCYIATETCNLQCHYCYIAQLKKFNNKLVSFPHPISFIRKALSKERLGGVCVFNFCAGGETLLSPEVLPLARELIKEGHYVGIVTNGTVSQRFLEIQEWSKEETARLFFKFSFHFLELKRKNWMNRFFENVYNAKAAGASFTVEITPSDELVPYIEEVKSICMEKVGALCHVTIARNDTKKGIDLLSQYTFEEYKNIWGSFDSELFRFKSELYQVKRKEFCYAGDWSIYVNLTSGDVYKCNCGYIIDNIYRDVEQPIKFEPVGHNCSLAYCYNGHAWLAFGDIPSLKSPLYADERNRVCADGSEWLQPEMKAIMSTKLYESNSEYSGGKKLKIRTIDKTKKIKLKCSSVVGRVKRKIKHMGVSGE